MESEALKVRYRGAESAGRDVKCDVCGAPRGRYCFNVGYGFSHGYYHKPHAARLRAAREEGERRG